MDILRLGHHLEVIEPAFLRSEVRAEIERMSSEYANTEC